MKLKIPKDDFLRNLHQVINQEIEESFNRRQPDYWGQKVKIDINEMIKNAISDSVVKAIDSLIEAQYTDEDFEKDLGLKS